MQRVQERGNGGDMKDIEMFKEMFQDCGMSFICDGVSYGLPNAQKDYIKLHSGHTLIFDKNGNLEKLIKE